MLKTRGESLEGKTCLVSGSGNVAQYTVEKITQLGGRAVTLSDSGGYIYDEQGIDAEKLKFVMELKNVRRGRIKEYADKFKGVVYTAIDPKLDYNPLWNHTAHCAFPSATQNEINGKDAMHLIRNGVYVVSEGANMPTTHRRRERVPAGQDPLRPRQGGQRRRRGDLGPRDVAEQPATELDARGGRPAAARDHEGDPQGRLRDRRSSTAARATTSTAPTSPASSRSPTR